MNKWILIIALSCLLIGCANKHCTFEPLAKSTNEIIVHPFYKGIDNTKQNLHGIREYVVADFEGAGPRMVGGAKAYYAKGDIDGIGSFFGMFGEQILEGWQATKRNFRTIAEYSCLCNECAGE